MSNETNDIQKAEARAIERNDSPRDLTPSQMLSSAIMQGMDTQTIEKLMDLQDREIARRAKAAYSQAIAHFKAICPTLTKTAKGHTNTYTRLVDIDEQIRPAMEQCNLTATWRIIQDDRDWIKVECRIEHGSGGHSETTALGGPPDRGPGRNELQARASTVSYLQRYTLKALLGLVDKDMPDDDGHGGAPSQPTKKAPPPRATIADASTADKAEFMRVARVKSSIDKPSREQCLAWLGQIQALGGATTVLECAKWLEENGEILDGKVQVTPSTEATDEATEGVTDDAPVDDFGARFACNKCGMLYTVEPDGNKCTATDDDGFPACDGTVVER